MCLMELNGVNWSLKELNGVKWAKWKIGPHPSPTRRTRGSETQKNMHKLEFSTPPGLEQGWSEPTPGNG